MAQPKQAAANRCQQKTRRQKKESPTEPTAGRTTGPKRANQDSWRASCNSPTGRPMATPPPTRNTSGHVQNNPAPPPKLRELRDGNLVLTSSVALSTSPKIPV